MSDERDSEIVSILISRRIKANGKKDNADRGLQSAWPDNGSIAQGSG
jgi:hypothetical protein